MEEDIEGFTREQLIAEIERLRAGVREHRDSTRHELCWRLGITLRLPVVPVVEVPRQ